jgi:hypothetical protein
VAGARKIAVILKRRERMTDLDRGLRSYDRPEILYRLFFPRRDVAADSERPRAFNRFVEVAEGISICCRCYPDGRTGRTFVFHGNGEVVSDYDYVAPVYAERGLNLFVAITRLRRKRRESHMHGMIKDAHPIFVIS